ncbi:TAT-variant-translocated molybdopterin oxidoreductase [Marinobacter fonticola]|uniref:TAT-variant-translocated molybdopterin oxidoreductase n=1 Tax=Marinobacter fonticola TaxID=2603215 RepID=UPI0011E6CA64|nr:TAT-variant-translocated molybdopterin oxidoreductase [Marinobacter fonticola]
MPPITSIDYNSLRERLAGQEGAGYWRSLAELAQTPEYQDAAAGEFGGEGKPWQEPVSRRNVLKLLGASMALAGVSGCSRQPEEHIVPYVNMPEQMVPGQARYYATTALIGGYAHGVLAESHEGRPTKLEGNPDHPATLGACDAIAQAAVLSLYDPDRSASVRSHGAIAGYGRCLMELSKKGRQWDERQGRGLAFVVGTVTSPSEEARIEALRDRWPQARWYVHEPVDRRTVYRGSEALFGRPLEPRYDFSNVDVAVSLDADFLQSQPGFLRYAHDFMARRRPRDRETQLARFYAVDSTPSVTGAMADHLKLMRYQEVELAARQLASALGLAVPAPEDAPLPDAWVTALVDDLRAHRGNALIIPGEQQSPAVHMLAHGMNTALDAVGNTMDWIEPVPALANAPDLSQLTPSIRAGEVEDLVVLGSNPVFTAPSDLDFEEAFQQVPWRLHWGEYRDETARLSHWHVPAAHMLETWGDGRAYDGTVSLVQPLIKPFHGGRSALQMLDALGSGVERNAHDLLVDFWRGEYTGADFDSFWRRSLHDGVVAETASAPQSVEPRSGWAEQLPAPPKIDDGLTLQLRPDPALWDGRYANNGWLQEQPRPITTLTWDNALLISPRLAEERDLVEGQVVKLDTEAGSLEVPVYILPGQPAHAVNLHLGHGRRSAGRVAAGVGSNAFTLRDSRRPWAVPVSIQVTDQHLTLAAIQTHHHIEDRDMVREASLETYRENPAFAQHEHHELSLYPEPWPAEREAEHAWGMIIDLSACTGCNACVTACQAENNIPIVGPEEVSRGHDMHWIRVDRYFQGELDGPRMTFQPVPCMHCENAPCEYVCPVGATQHSADGLNEMLYQRCVGTRYCSQNCPYKVRRFNWFDYTSAQAAYPAEPAVQNPDVTVRSRGVMEKCTYCVQRINTVRQNAEAEERPIAEGELKTACQQSCPTEAIVFGDLAKPDSEVARLKAHPLNYAMLGGLNTRPRTTYLAAVRNPNPALEGKG